MAIEFNGSGSGQWVSLGNLDLPSGLTALSIFAWVIFDSWTTGDQRICAKATSHDIDDHWFMLSGNTSSQNRVRLKTGGTTLTHFENNLAMSLGTLYHIGFVYNGSNVTFYRDGAANGSSAQTGTIDTSASVEVRIADNPGINRKEFDGKLEDVRIYKRALSADEVKTIHALRGQDDIVDGLLHRWLLNEGYDGQSASGSGLNKDFTCAVNGTPAGSPAFRASNLNLVRPSMR